VCVGNIGFKETGSMIATLISYIPNEVETNDAPKENTKHLF